MRLKRQLLAVCAVMLALMALVSIASIKSALPSYYHYRKVETMRRMTDELEENISSLNSVEYLTRLQHACAQRNISLTLYDQNMMQVAAFYTQGSEGASGDALGQDASVRFATREYTSRQSGAVFLEAHGVLQGGYRYVASTSLEAVDEAVEYSSVFITLVMAVALPLALAAMSRLVTRITRPLKELTGQMEDIRQGQMDIEYVPSGATEIVELGNSFLDMRSRLALALGELEDANEDLQKKIEQIETMNAAKREFFSIASHELKTPVACIEGYASLIEDETDEKTVLEYAQSITETSEGMMEKIKQMLAQCRAEDALAACTIEPVDTGRIADKLGAQICSVLEEKDVNLCGNLFDGSTAAVMQTDPVLFQHILQNLLTNAVDFVKTGGVVKASLDRISGGWLLSVYDEGPHIKEENLEKIWDRFYKEDRYGGRHFGGTGLGLSIVAAAVEKLKGTAEARNVKDGVVFEIFFPRLSEPSSSGFAVRG